MGVAAAGTGPRRTTCARRRAPFSPQLGSPTLARAHRQGAARRPRGTEPASPLDALRDRRASAPGERGRSGRAPAPEAGGRGRAVSRRGADDRATEGGQHSVGCRDVALERFRPVAPSPGRGRPVPPPAHGGGEPVVAGPRRVPGRGRPTRRAVRTCRVRRRPLLERRSGGGPGRTPLATVGPSRRLAEGAGRTDRGPRGPRVRARRRGKPPGADDDTDAEEG